jgi:segregation and condensation protein B
MKTLENQIEAILFYKNEPMKIKKLAELFDIKETEAKEALKKLANSLENRGICLVMTETEASLTTAPETKELIEQIAKDEMSLEIGKAGLETLAIILYNGPVSRREIDYIRGVNSTFILRNLCVRGLVEKESDPKDQRIWRYRGSLAALTYLGVKKIEELPDFETFKEELAQIRSGNNEE